jgi:hypothetical protein
MTGSAIFEEFSRIRASRQERSRRAFEASLDAFEALLRGSASTSCSTTSAARRCGEGRAVE